MSEEAVPQDWIIALGGGGGEICLFNFEEQGLDRSATDAMMSREVKLPPIKHAVAQAESKGEDAHNVERLSSNDCSEKGGAMRATLPSGPAEKKHDPFSMSSLMENARRMAKEKREEEEAQARGEKFQRWTSSNAMDCQLRIHAEHQKEIQTKLKALCTSLKKFDLRAAEAKIEHECVRLQARAEAQKMWKGLKVVGAARPCPFDTTPPDMILKILGFLSGKNLFQVLMASRKFQCTDKEFWVELMFREKHELVDPALSGREVKALYRHNTERWARLISTLAWLKSHGCPSDVHGSRKGPWSKTTLTAVLRDTITFTSHTAAPWRRQEVVVYLQCMTSLLRCAHESIKELAASVLANIVTSDAARDLLVRHDGVKALQEMLYTNSLAMQKQATRAMVNAWVDDDGLGGVAPSPVAPSVVAPCDASFLNSPLRPIPWSAPLPLPTSCHVHWLCVDFSPTGTASAPYTVMMSQRDTATSSLCRLQGHGEDSMGRFRISEATLNRSLQWMSGTCVDDDEAARVDADEPPNLHHLHPHLDHLHMPLLPACPHIQTPLSASLASCTLESNVMQGSGEMGAGASRIASSGAAASGVASPPVAAPPSNPALAHTMDFLKAGSWLL